MFLALQRAGETVEARIQGTQHGLATVVQHTRTHITIHVRGGQYWAGRGETGYAGATLDSYAILEEIEPGLRFRVERVVSVPIRWKESALQYAQRVRDGEW